MGDKMVLLYALLIWIFNSGSAALSFLGLAVVICFISMLSAIIFAPRSVFPANAANQSLSMRKILNNDASAGDYLFTCVFLSLFNLIFFPGNFFSFGLIAMAIVYAAA